MNLAYADPPYLGQGARRYDRPEWDEPARHRQLIEELCDIYPDGWALSASSPSLCILAPMMPRDVRVGAWCKSFGTFKRGVRPAYMWEPVFYRGGHNPPWEPHPPPTKGGKQTTPKDFIVEPIALRRGLTGAKPPKVCAWILDLLNFQATDTLTDLYPGTGIMGTVVAGRAA